MNKNEYTELHLFVENGVDKGEAYLKDIYMALKRWLPKDYKLLPDLRFTNLFIGEVPKFNCFITTALAISPDCTSEIVFGITSCEFLSSRESHKSIRDGFKQLKSNYEYALSEEKKNGTLPPDGVKVEYYLVIGDSCENMSVVNSSKEDSTQREQSC